MELELKNMINTSEVAVPTPVSSVHQRVIGTRWPFKLKSDELFQARFVALGRKQRNDCGITFPSVCRFDNWQLLLLIALATLCVCVCVFSSLSFWTSSSLDVPAGVTQEEGHTGFFIHLLSAVRALTFLARRIQPFLSLVDREVEFCVLTI